MMFADRCDYAASDSIVNAALEHGLNFIDTAAMYTAGACEEFLGRILKGKRDQVLLGTKVAKGVDRESILQQPRREPGALADGPRGPVSHPLAGAGHEPDRDDGRPE